MSTTTPITFAVEETYRRLTEHLRELQGVGVAFSGGVDSSLVLAAAVDALGSQCLAVTACSATYPDEEKVRAIEIARFLSARHRVIDTHELEDPAYRSNPPNRCYHCKRELFERLRAIASEAGCTTLVDGSNQDDRTDYRPGRQAVQEYAVRSPLAELGLARQRFVSSRAIEGFPTGIIPPVPASLRESRTARRSPTSGSDESAEPKQPCARSDSASCGPATMAPWSVSSSAVRTSTRLPRPECGSASWRAAAPTATSLWRSISKAIELEQ